jgi:uncharacterized lipoprotein YddW (UPF0748 family)
MANLSRHKGTEMHLPKTPFSGVILAVVMILGSWANCALADPSFGDFRGLWLSRFEFNEDNTASIQNQVNRAADMGITDIIWQVRGKADAYYNSNYETPAEDWQGIVDPLQVALDTAHNRGMKLHAWINSMPIWRDTAQPTNPNHIFHNSNPSFRVTDINGNVEQIVNGNSTFNNNSYARVNHVLPEVQTHINNVVNDIATNYNVDGIHLDYIRWLGPGDSGDGHRPDWDYLPHDSVSHQLYFNETGQDASDGSTFNKREAYRDWVQGKITDLVTSVGQTIDAAEITEGREIKLSAAVWNNPTVAENEYMQDYRTWLEQDLLDIAIPMVYLRESNRHLMEGFLDDIFGTATNTDISIGLGTYLHTNDPGRGGVPETISQMQQVYDDGGADSLTFFSYNSLLNGSSLSNERRQAVIDWYDEVTTIPGDYNSDGLVNAADYTVWQDSWLQFGEDLPADGDGDGFIGNSDYDIWVANYGAPFASSSSSAAVPEPTTLTLVIGLVALCRRLR